MEKKDRIQRLVSYNLNEIHEDINIFFDGEKELLFNNIKKYDVIVNFNYSNAFHSLLIRKAKENNILSILLQDGIFEWNNTFVKNKKMPLYHPITHDVFFSFGGDQEFKYLQQVNTLLPVKFFKYIPDFLNKKSIAYDKDKFDFLITTANSAYFNNSELVRLCNLINETIDNLVNLNLSFKLRIFDKRILSNINAAGYSINDLCPNISECLLDVRCVLTTRSTLIFEAIGASKPVGEFLYRDVPQFSNPAWLVHSNIDFPETLNSMIFMDENRMAMQVAMYNSHMTTSTVNDLHEYVIKLNKTDIYKRKLLVLLKILLGK
ncbi:hypothetical protein [Pectobacterium brasiliense]|uniref:hypothetical protein n=1 Tax=Pectobacterium brasiliense TaxID=180957 RepID=UPI0013DF85A6|nr:hypothetical protein [Pectobacterium brasiliense]